MAPVFLATFLIGLREGLEAALIVSILAAFLRREGRSLKPLLAATGLAVLIGIAVGVALMVLEQALPQAQQEALETVIGVVAIVFVTTMIIWMKHNARYMKQNLEQGAASKLKTGGALAMAGMAFLAVLKEGFETAVFLLAVFTSLSGGSSQALGVAGAVVGVVLAVVIGYLIYFGGSRFNLGLFFKATGPFLILVAAGFVAAALRTGHEAGWINIGQQQVMSLPFLANGTVLGALVTGMFGIQPDPRLIEVIGYFMYLVPVMVVYCWPSSRAFSLRQRMLTKRVAAVGCAVVALGMFLLAPKGSLDVGATRPLQDGGNAAEVTLVSADVNGGKATLKATGGNLGDDGETGELDLVSTGDLDGAPLAQWEGKQTVTPSEDLGLKTDGVTLEDLTKLNNGKIPSGLNKERTPGPFTAEWEESVTFSAQTSGDSLLAASRTGKLLARLSGGGIDDSKTVSVSGAVSAENWQVSEDETDTVESNLQSAKLNADELTLYWMWIPCTLGVLAVVFCVAMLLDMGALRKEGAPSAAPNAPKASGASA